MKQITIHLLIWLTVFAVECFLTRGNQPSWPMTFFATAVLTLGSAAMVYFDRFVLRRRCRTWFAYGLTWLSTVLALAFLTVPIIQAAYDVVGVPREVRFDFFTNLGLESAWYAVHALVATMVWRSARYNHSGVETSL